MILELEDSVCGATLWLTCKPCDYDLEIDNGTSLEDLVELANYHLTSEEHALGEKPRRD